MAAAWTLAKKELRLLVRDPRAALVLLGMPLLFILVLGLLLGEGFGQKPDNRLRVSLVDEDEGLAVERAAAWLALTPSLAGVVPSPPALAAVSLAAAHDLGRFPPQRWSDVVRRDLQETAGIKVEIIPDRATARRLCESGKRPAVLVFGPDFSRRVAVCSFLSEGVNPFYRDGISLKDVGAELIRDPTQPTTAAVIDQVVQVTLMRVIMPWMIGKAFEKISAEDFIERLGRAVRMPVPQGDSALERKIIELKFQARGVQVVDGKVSLNEALKVAARDERAEADYRRRVGEGVQTALSAQFSKYDLTGKTWAKLTRSEPRDGGAGEAAAYRDEGGRGLLHRGAARYQVLVPAYTVMFAFALTLVVGWLFVSERRRGTLKRLRTAPVTGAQLLAGKFLPCLALAVFQGLFLMLAGKLAFGLRWGPESWPWPQQLAALVPVVVCTALAAMGLAMLVAAVARTEMQVAIYGSLLVLVLGLLSGCVFPRELMPERARAITLVTPHAWALDAYNQLMLNPRPNLAVVALACAVLTGFGLAFLALAWHFLGRHES